MQFLPAPETFITFMNFEFQLKASVSHRKPAEVQCVFVWSCWDVVVCVLYINQCEVSTGFLLTGQYSVGRGGGVPACGSPRRTSTLASRPSCVSWYYRGCRLGCRLLYHSCHLVDVVSSLRGECTGISRVVSSLGVYSLC